MQSNRKIRRRGNFLALLRILILILFVAIELSIECPLSESGEAPEKKDVAQPAQTSERSEKPVVAPDQKDKAAEPEKKAEPPLDRQQAAGPQKPGLAPQPPKDQSPSEAFSTYSAKKVVDAVTNPLMLIVILITIILYRGRHFIESFLQDLTTVAYGQVQLTRRGAEDLKSGFEEFDVSSLKDLAFLPEGIPNFLAFKQYPVVWINKKLDIPYMNLDWDKVKPWLENLEPRLAFAERRILNSRYFSDANAPQDFVYARSQIYNFLICLGNLYGFSKVSPYKESRPIDDTRAISYLKRAKELMPKEGYAYFCSAAVQGALGIRLFEGNDPVAPHLTRGYGRALMKAAVEDLQSAEKNNHSFALHIS